MTGELFREDAYRKACEAVVTAADEHGVVLDRTVFYPEGGGQPGDTGELRRADGSVIPVVDTRRDRATGAIRHLPAAGAPRLTPGERVNAVIDWERRHRHMRMHTCLHLLCSLVPAGVTGGSVGEDRGRLDFDLPGQTLDKDRLTAELNRIIRADFPVGTRWISDVELASQPELVRTMSVRPPTGQGRVRLVSVEGVDLQPCGGTHVSATGEIGSVRVARIENKGRANRRVSVVFDDDPA